VAWLAEQLTDVALVYRNEYELGHMSFHIAKDMSYFEDVLQILGFWNS